MDIESEFEQIAEESANLQAQERYYEEPKTLQELHHNLYNAGEEWRGAHTEFRDGKSPKIKPVSPRDTADIIRKCCHVILIGEANPETSPLAIYDPTDGIYKKGERFINQLCLKVERTLNSGACKQVVHYLETESEEQEIERDDKYIVMNNGIYDKSKEKLLPFNHELVFQNKINTNYNPDATEPVFDGWKFSDWLKELSDGDEKKHHLLWQVIATTINCNDIAEVSFFFISEQGSTGKSTFQELLINLVGAANSTSLKIREFEKPFKFATSYGKSLVIGDDNNPKDFNDTNETFKSAVTGDIVLFEPKGKSPFTGYLVATIVQSMNGMPRFSDVSDGLLRRIRAIKFNHVYKNTKKNPLIKKEYIKDERLHEWIVKQAVDVDTSEIINTEESIQEVEELELDNDIVKAFILEVVPTLQSDRIPTKFLYTYFRAWCDYENGSPTSMTRRVFTRRAKPLMLSLGFEHDARSKYPKPHFSQSDMNNLKDTDISYRYNIKINDTQQQPLFYRK